MSQAPRQGPHLPSAPRATMTWASSSVPGGCLAISIYLPAGDPLGDIGSQLLFCLGQVLQALVCRASSEETGTGRPYCIARRGHMQKGRDLEGAGLFRCVLGAGAVHCLGRSGP
eukprot:6640180-Pyramimonas_sp.AAC.1